MGKKIIIITWITLILIFAVAVVLRQSRPVNIAYMVNSAYLPYAAVSLESAIESKNKETIYHVHFIAEKFSAKDIAALKSMESETVRIFIYPTKELNLDLTHLGRFSSFGLALQKLFIADYLKDIEKVLYLDADTLVQDDLSEVYNISLQDVYAAAVKDGLMYQFPEHVASLKKEMENFYFNSGIMLLNLQKIREDGIMQQAVIYFNTHEEIFGDQDILNVVFAGKVKPLSYRYNCNSTFFEEKDAEFLSNFYKEPVPRTPREVYDNAVILHFAGHKPWTEWFTHTYLKPLWQQYADTVRAKHNIMF